MNDRYLYKAKKVDNGQWITGNLIEDGVAGQIFIHAAGNSVNESDMVGEEGYLKFVAFEIDPEAICKRTGLKDKNGKLIWENSKCSVSRPCVYAIGKIKYIKGCFCFVEDLTGNILFSRDIWRNGYEIKVEGDNPELLEV